MVSEFVSEGDNRARGKQSRGDQRDYKREPTAISICGEKFHHDKGTSEFYRLTSTLLRNYYSLSSGYTTCAQVVTNNTGQPDCPNDDGAGRPIEPSRECETQRVANQRDDV